MTARDAARSWLAADPDPDTRAELEELLAERLEVVRKTPHY